MPLAMNREVFITCPVTGSGASQDRSPLVPRSPKQIADSAVEAAKAGAAVVHCHVRDPETGAPSRDRAMFREVTERIRDAGTDVVLNLTAGMGGDLVLGAPERPLPLADGTDMASAAARMQHVLDCRPEICTLDCGTMNFAENDYVMTNTPGMLRAMAKMMTDAGVRPEIEAFDVFASPDERRERLFELLEHVREVCAARLPPPPAGALLSPGYQLDLEATRALLDLQSERVIAIGE